MDAHALDDLAGHARARPGGRSARVGAAVLAATLAVLAERGYEGASLPEIARRAGVHPTSVYRRWGTKARLVGEAILEQGLPLIPTPDTGTLRGDLEDLLIAGAAIFHTPPVRALFEVLLSEAGDPSPRISRARDRFWEAHLRQARAIVERAVARSELPASTDPAVLVELLIGPALVRSLLMGRDLRAADASEIVERVLAVPLSVDGPTAVAARGGGVDGGSPSVA